MSKKKNLLKLFSQDISYYFHTIKKENPDGHLIYVLKSDSNLDVEKLEFSPTHIIEELFHECDLKVEKFAPAVFFSEITNTDELKYKLTEKMEENDKFSSFIESIKDNYRILEIKDSLLYKKDPEEYNQKMQKEKEEKQKDILEKVIEQQKEQQKKREEALLKFNNNIFNLLKDTLKYTIQYEKTDFDYQKTINNIMTNLIDIKKWIMENNKPYNCNIYIHKLNQKSIGVFLSNHQTGYTATLKMNKTKIIAKNIIKLGDEDEVPKYFKDYEFLIKLYDVDTSIFNDWDFKNDTDKFECIINYLAPIFKKEIDDKYKEEVEKHMKEQDMIKGENE